MSTTHSNPTIDGDERLLDDALGVVRDARSRLPSDFLVAIGAFLVLVAAALLAIGVSVGGRVGDLAINLAVEVLGALLTVVVIDGLWSRAQSGSAERLRLVEDRLQRRIRAQRRVAARLSESERAGWGDVISEYRGLTARDSLLDRLAAARDYGRRARRIEKLAEQLLADETTAGADS
jgi:hypothetical protein